MHPVCNQQPGIHPDADADADVDTHQHVSVGSTFSPIQSPPRPRPAHVMVLDDVRARPRIRSYQGKPGAISQD